MSQWFDKILLDNSSYNKAIVDITNEKLIGYTGISQISEVNLSGEYFIFIGDKSYHGKGIGTFITKKIIENGFQLLGLNRIMLTVSEKNIGAIKAYTKAYTKANFKTEGVMKQAFYIYGQFQSKNGALIIRDLKKVPTGMNLTVKHLDGTIIEYVQHKNVNK
nr:GNAT family protein [Clostridium akagii]